MHHFLLRKAVWTRRDPFITLVTVGDFQLPGRRAGLAVLPCVRGVLLALSGGGVGGVRRLVCFHWSWMVSFGGVGVGGGGGRAPSGLGPLCGVVWC